MRSLLFTDFYQLTMAQLYLEAGLHDTESVFEYTFRHTPDYGSHKAGYAVAAGLEPLLDSMAAARLSIEERDHLLSVRSSTGEPLFGPDFIDWLGDSPPFASLSMRAVPEGRIVHPFTPLASVRGPLGAAQLLETVLLNQLNYATLIATKASRIVDAAQGRPVLEFGLRRSPGVGGNTASRSALIGGAVATSNVAAAMAAGEQAAGTHAHSMVQAFMALRGPAGELEAFRHYAAAYPDDCLLLVDTIDTLDSGIPHAITVFSELASAGHTPVGVRLDSGDLAHLAVQAAVMLADAGFPETRIVLSSSLDELRIFQILAQIDQEAPRYGIDGDAVFQRLAFGVGSRLVSSQGQPYLDGVYKLSAMRTADGEWESAVKLSEVPWKTPTPGPTDVVRLYDQRGLATADVVTVAGEALDIAGPLVLQHPVETDVRRELPSGAVSSCEPLMVDVLVDGERVDQPEPIARLAARRHADIDRLDPGVRRLVEPHRYHVSLSAALAEKKAALISRARGR